MSQRFFAYIFVDYKGGSGYGNCEVTSRIKTIQDIRMVEEKLERMNNFKKVTVLGWQEFK